MCDSCGCPDLSPVVEPSADHETLGALDRRVRDGLCDGDITVRARRSTPSSTRCVRTPPRKSAGCSPWRAPRATSQPSSISSNAPTPRPDVGAPGRGHASCDVCILAWSDAPPGRRGVVTVPNPVRSLERILGRDLRGALADDIRATRLSQARPGTPIEGADIADLPSSARRYLEAMGVVGRPRDESFVAHLTGTFRLRPKQRFMRCEAWQCNTADPLARLFHMRIDLAGVVPMVGRDAYASGRGAMRGRLLGLVTVAKGEGEEFDVGELTTWLNDAVIMCPSMLLTPAVSFDALDDTTFDVSCRHAGRTVTARVFLDEVGHPRDFRTTDRYADLPGGLRRAEWSTPLSGWHDVHGRALPSAGRAVWKLEDGDLTYLQVVFRDDAITYNPNLVPTRPASASGG